MTLLAEIRAKCDQATLASKDYAAIAAAVSIGRTATRPTIGGIGLVLETLGPDAGATLLDALEVQAAEVSALKWAWVLLNRGDMDFGSPTTRSMIEMLIASPAKDALLAVSEFPDPVTAHACEVAMKNDDGTEK